MMSHRVLAVLAAALVAESGGGIDAVDGGWAVCDVADDVRAEAGPQTSQPARTAFHQSSHNCQGLDERR